MADQPIVVLEPQGEIFFVAGREGQSRRTYQCSQSIILFACPWLSVLLSTWGRESLPFTVRVGQEDGDVEGIGFILRVLHGDILPWTRISPRFLLSVAMACHKYDFYQGLRPYMADWLSEGEKQVRDADSLSYHLLSIKYFGYSVKDSICRSRVLMHGFLQECLEESYAQVFRQGFLVNDFALLSTLCRTCNRAHIRDDRICRGIEIPGIDPYDPLCTAESRYWEYANYLKEGEVINKRGNLRTTLSPEGIAKRLETIRLKVEEEHHCTGTFLCPLKKIIWKIERVARHMTESASTTAEPLAAHRTPRSPEPRIKLPLTLASPNGQLAFKFR